jgi:predicted dehydrogenase
MINLATIGTSSITECFLKGCSLTGRFAHNAVFSRNFKKGKDFADKDGCKKIYTDLNELAKDNSIDAVYIASVNSCHYDQSKLMLENGKNVICEKPIVTSLKDYLELKSLADKNGLVYLEAITSHHSPTREKVVDGINAVGKIAQIRIDFCQRSSRLDRFLRGEEVNVFNMSLHGGALNDLGVYCIYAALDLFGVPKDIKAAVSYLDNGADSAGNLIFDYGGKTAAITYSKTGQSALGSEIVGQDATLTIGSVSQFTDVKLFKNGKAEILVPDIDKPHIMCGEANDFADFIEKKDGYKERYENSSKLCKNVHSCMDKVKSYCKIKY